MKNKTIEGLELSIALIEDLQEKARKDIDDDGTDWSEMINRGLVWSYSILPDGSVGFWADIEESPRHEFPSEFSKISLGGLDFIAGLLEETKMSSHLGGIVDNSTDCIRIIRDELKETIMKNKKQELNKKYKTNF
jgi:hypothetical protein